MAQHHDHRGILVPQDTNFDNADQPGIAQPYSQTEVEDLLYGNDRPASERLARLRQMRDEAAIRESGDFGEEDPAALMDELDRAIDELSATLANGEDTDDYAALEGSYDQDPADHLDALSPDDVDARRALEGDDEDGIEPLDDAEWQENDGFRPERGVH